jgi:hypothetical protein
VIDLTNLNALLAGLGPWGILIGAGLTIGVNWFRNRRNPQPAPAPADPANPNAPAPKPSGTPILDMVLDVIRKRLRPVSFQSLPAEPDLTPEEAVEILNKLKL